MRQILSLTMPQIIMLNHASHINKQRLDVKIKEGRDTGTQTVEEAVADAPVYKGKRLDELTSEEYLAYLRG
jgi:hypothetical protein